MEGFLYRTEVKNDVAVTATGDKFTFAPGCPIEIIRWGIIVKTKVDVGAGMTIKMDHRPTAGDDTSRTDGTGGADLTASADIAQGKGAYVEPDKPFEVDPGEEVVFQVTDAADTAGEVHIFFMYQERPFQPPRIDNLKNVT